MAKDKNSPFIPVTCKCPVCNREASHRYIKSKLYTPTEVEGDQHVVTYKWESPRFEGIRPNFYHIWHCPTCHFCDEKEAFRGKDDSGGKLELIQEKVLISSKDSQSVINRLGNAVDMTEEFISLPTALCAHLQAMYIQELLSPNMRQFGKLARLYLRTAWLYRERKLWAVPDTNVPAGFSRLEDFFVALKEEWHDMPLTEEIAIEKAIDYYRHDLDRSNRLDDVRHELTVLFLITDLQRRLGHRDDAVANVRYIFQVATTKRQSTRQVLDNAVSRGRGTQQQIETLRSLVTWLNNSVERATELAEELNNEIFHEEYPRARDIVMKMVGTVTPQEIQEALKKEGFHDITARRLAALVAKKGVDRVTNEDPDALQNESDNGNDDEPKSFWQSIKDKLSGQ